VAASKKEKFSPIYSEGGPMSWEAGTLAMRAAEARAAERIRTDLPSFKPDATEQHLKRSYDLHVLPYEAMFDRYAKESGVDPKILKAVVMVEQRGNERAGKYRSSTDGASGLMQLMPVAVEKYKVDVTSPQDSIRGAAQYLADLQKKFGEDPAALGAAYHSGETIVRSYGQAYPSPKFGDRTRAYATMADQAYNLLTGTTREEVAQDRVNPTNTFRETLLANKVL
jgi:soluble lytic murein transglycosylase-like protein